MMINDLPPERFTIGDSDDCEAEYGSRADDPVTVLEFYNGEITSYYGFATIAAAKAHLIAGGAVPAQISYL
jgi:hypothetical protein